MTIRTAALGVAFLLLAGPVGAAPPNPGFAAKLTYSCPNGTLPGECAVVGGQGASILWFKVVLLPAAATPSARLDPKDLHGARETAEALGLATALRTYRDPKGTSDPGGDRYDQQIREAAQQILFMERSFAADGGRSLVDVCVGPGCAPPAETRADVAGAADAIRYAAERIFEAGLGAGPGVRGGRSAGPRLPGFEGLEGRID